MKIAHQIVGSLLLISVFLKAQTTYITDSTYFQRISFFYYIQDSSFHSYQYSYPDTSVLGFQNSLPFYFNGQIGTTQPDYLLQNMNTEIGSRVLNVYYPDEVRPTQVDIFRTKGFYSKLEGIAGSKDEQHFRAWFLSPIRSHSQINFYLRRSTNTGFYQNQKGSVTNVFADYHFFSKKKISMDAQILLNFIKHQENGGIVKDTLSYNDLLVDKILIPVNLPDAKKNYQSQFFHYQINYLLNHRHALSLGMDANKQLFHYQDNFPTSGYYSFVFIDTTKTNDSLHSWKVNMPLSYTFQYKKTAIKLSYEYQRNWIHLYADTLMQNHFVNLTTQTEFKFFQQLKITHTHRLQYIFSGTQKSNYALYFLFQTNYQFFQFHLLADILKQSPYFQQNYWYSNHFIWSNRFKDIQTQHVSLSANYFNSILITYHFYHINNCVFYVDNYPQQYTNSLYLHQIKLELKKLFFRHLGIQSAYYYQWKSSNVIAFPEHFLKADLYYQGKWFKKNLLVNSGVQFISAFNYFDTYQYNPATGLYSIRTSPFQAGNYPQVGVYFSGRVKPVNFFIRMDYLLAGIYPQPYYYVPHYMMPDRSFRMGISWMFFD